MLFKKPFKKQRGKKEEEEERGLEGKAVGLARYYFAVPSWRKTLIYLLTFSFIAGFALHVMLSLSSGRLAIPGMPSQVSWSDALLFGGTEGIILFTFPAVLAALLTAGFHRRAFKENFRRLLFVGFISAIATIVAYSLGATLAASASEFHAAILLANALAYIIWFVACFLALGTGVPSFAAAAFHPMLSLAFLQMWQAYGVLEMGSPALVALKLLLACGILLLALWSFFFIINAPAKRNFGISSVQAVTLLFAQTLKKSKALESLLEEMGEPTDTLLGMLAFRAKRGSSAKRSMKPKALFLVPHVHYGPFGNLGGSEFPFLLSQMLSSRFGCDAFVFHSTTTHDFNPVHASTVLDVATAYARALEGLSKRRRFASEATLVEGGEDAAKVRGVAFGKNAFLVLTRAPQRTDDIDFAAGLALKARAESRGYAQALLVDAHNSLGVSKWIEAGSKEFYEYDDALAAIATHAEAARHSGGLKLGVASTGIEATPAQGVGRAGIKVAVFEASSLLRGEHEAGGKRGKARACLILVDGNNALPEFRAMVLASLEKYGFNWCELLTTDTHAVNSLAETYNPLGRHPEVSQTLIHTINECVQEALADLEPVEAAVDVQRAKIAVLGAKRAPELLSTINSIVSITKILAPAIFAASITLAFLSLVLLK